jgi:hypothetical protein
MNKNIRPLGDQPTERLSGVPRDSLLARVRHLRLNALKARSRQRIRELERREVRVPSSLWEQVVRDYDRTIRELETAPAKTTYTVERYAKGKGPAKLPR